MTTNGAFDQDFLNKMDTKLQEEKERLEKELSQFAKKNSRGTDNFDADFPSMGDAEDENAAEVATYSDNLTLEHTLESSLRDINDALARIKEGKYGLCRYCGKSIDLKRLEARPASSACVECKEKLSRK